MSSCVDHVVPEQLYYIPCSVCNIVLAVSVPCSSLFETVTVRCGHCSNLWTVNMAAAFQSLSNSSNSQDFQAPNYSSYPDYRIDHGSTCKYSNKMPIRSTTAEERAAVNPPPEKRQRVPSAYNQFIKEEIQRIKASNPDISHREAFSTAAKNWAHFPHIHFELMLDSNNQAKLNLQQGSGNHLMPRATPVKK